MANKRLGFIASLAMLPSSALCAATYVCIVKFIFYSTTQLKLLGLGEMYHSRSAILVSNFDFFPLYLLSSLSLLISENIQTALIPFIVAGDPDLATTAKALKILDACGSDVIELGVPYSDPLADGPVIQASATRALAKGTTFDDVISMVKEVTPELSCPVSLFTYYNPILKRGIPNFMTIVKEAGLRGLVVPDVPLEETEFLRSEAAKNNLELVVPFSCYGLHLVLQLLCLDVFFLVNRIKNSL